MHAFQLWFMLLVSALLCLPALSQDYYPLQVGNSWFYRSIYQVSGDTSIMSSFRVTRDSLFSNGLRYFVLDSIDIMESRFVRTDSGFVCYLDPGSGQDQKVFDLNANIGETIGIHLGSYFTIRLVAKDTREVLGFVDSILTYRLDGLVSPSVRKISKRFGPLYEERFTDGPPPWPYYGRTLVGCTIGGRNYGRTLDVAPELGFVRKFELHQNFPNPFNPATTITFAIHATSDVTLIVSDILGRQVRVLVNGILPPGLHTEWWDGRNDQGVQMSSGVYFYEMKSQDARQVRRMCLLK